MPTWPSCSCWLPQSTNQSCPGQNHLFLERKTSLKTARIDPEFLYLASISVLTILSPLGNRTSPETNWVLSSPQLASRSTHPSRLCGTDRLKCAAKGDASESSCLSTHLHSQRWAILGFASSSRLRPQSKHQRPQKAPSLRLALNLILWSSRFLRIPSTGS